MLQPHFPNVGVVDAVRVPLTDVGAGLVSDFYSDFPHVIPVILRYDLNSSRSTIMIAKADL